MAWKTFGTFRPHRTHRIAVACILLCGTSFSGSAVSATMPVIDTAAIAQQIKQYTETLTRWKTTLEHYKNTFQHYQKTINHFKQQLADVKSMTWAIAKMPKDFPKRPETWGVNDACPSSNDLGSILRFIVKLELPKINGSITKQQTQLCQMIVVAENSKYNRTIDLLERITSYRDSFVDQIENHRNESGDSQGKLASNDNEVNRFVARTTLDVQHWQADMIAHDQYIASLRTQQMYLAKRAMHGEHPLGEWVQAAALKAALQ